MTERDTDGRREMERDEDRETEPAPALPSRQTEAPSWPRASCQLLPPSLPARSSSLPHSGWGLGLRGAPAAAVTHGPPGSLGGPASCMGLLHSLGWRTRLCPGWASGRTSIGRASPRSLTCEMGLQSHPLPPAVTCPLRTGPGLGTGNSGAGGPAQRVSSWDWSGAAEGAGPLVVGTDGCEAEGDKPA